MTEGAEFVVGQGKPAWMHACIQQLTNFLPPQAVAQTRTEVLLPLIDVPSQAGGVKPVDMRDCVANEAWLTAFVLTWGDETSPEVEDISRVFLELDDGLGGKLVPVKDALLKANRVVAEAQKFRTIFHWFRKLLNRGETSRDPQLMRLKQMAVEGRKIKKVSDMMAESAPKPIAEPLSRSEIPTSPSASSASSMFATPLMAPSALSQLHSPMAPSALSQLDSPMAPSAVSQLGSTALSQAPSTMASSAASMKKLAIQKLGETLQHASLSAEDDLTGMLKNLSEVIESFQGSSEEQPPSKRPRTAELGPPSFAQDVVEGLIAKPPGVVTPTVQQGVADVITDKAAGKSSYDILQEPIPDPQRSIPDNIDSTVHDEFMRLPNDALPKGPCTGKFNFTVTAGGGKVEVSMKDKKFQIKHFADRTIKVKNPSIPWRDAGVDKAWHNCLARMASGV